MDDGRQAAAHGDPDQPCARPGCPGVVPAPDKPGSRHWGRLQKYCSLACSQWGRRAQLKGWRERQQPARASQEPGQEPAPQDEAAARGWPGR